MSLNTSSIMCETIHFNIDKDTYNAFSRKSVLQRFWN